MRDQVEGASVRFEQQMVREAKAADAPAPSKPISEMTWPERAADAAVKAEAKAIWEGATPEQAQKAAEEAGEAVMRRAAQFGYVEVKKANKFDASKPQPKKLSPVEQARYAGMHAVGLAGPSGAGTKGGGRFGITAPMMTGGLEGGGYMG